MEQGSRKNIIQALIQADNGDQDAIKSLMEFYCEAVERDSVPDRAVLAYFASAFREILEDTEIGKPLQFPRKQGRPGGDNEERDFLIAMTVVVLMQDGKTKDEAHESVSEVWIVSESTVNRAWLAWKDMVDDKDIERYGEDVLSAFRSSSKNIEN